MAQAKSRYVALLRAVNVGGHSVVKMAPLRALLESSGFTDVASYIQSGNILFTAHETDPERLARRLEKKIASAFGSATAVFVLSPAQLKAAAARNPFDPERLDKQQLCHLMFLSRQPDPAHRAALMARQGRDYRFRISGKVLYYAHPRRVAGHRRTVNFERVLGVTGTARSWKVVKKLIELTGSAGLRETTT
jgi:uncharacterized protein (DUF1697 family)